MNRNELLKALESVRPGLASRELIENTTSFCFMNDRIITYNDEISIMYPIEIGIEGVVSANELYTLLKKIEDDEVNIKQNKNEISIKGKNFKSGIRYSSEINLPLDRIEEPDEWKKLPSNFNETTKTCMISVGKEADQPILSCIHYTGNTAESCDGYRITVTDMEDSIEDELIIPVGSLKDLIKYNLDSYSVTESWIHFKTEEGAIFSCRTFGESYPDVSSVLDKDEDGVNIEFPNEIKKMVEKANIFNSDKSELDSFVTITIKDGKLTVEGSGENGYFQESTDINSDSDVSFRIVPKFLIQLLGVGAEAEVYDNIIIFTDPDPNNELTHAVRLFDDEED